MRKNEGIIIIVLYYHIEMSWKMHVFGYVYLVHYTLYTTLHHNQGGYYNSLILQALDLPPLAHLLC